MLEQTLDELDEAVATFKAMNEHWSKGDSEGMAKLVNDLNAQSPEIYKIAADGPQCDLGGLDRQAARQAGCRIRRRRRGPPWRQGQRPGPPSEARNQERALQAANSTTFSRGTRAAGVETTPAASTRREIIRFSLNIARLFLISR